MIQILSRLFKIPEIPDIPSSQKPTHFEKLINSEIIAQASNDGDIINSSNQKDMLADQAHQLNINDVEMDEKDENQITPALKTVVTSDLNPEHMIIDIPKTFCSTEKAPAKVITVEKHPFGNINLKMVVNIISNTNSIRMNNQQNENEQCDGNISLEDNRDNQKVMQQQSKRPIKETPIMECEENLKNMEKSVSCRKKMKLGDVSTIMFDQNQVTILF